MDSVYRNQLRFGSLAVDHGITPEVAVITSCFGNVSRSRPNTIFTNADTEKLAECTVSQLRALQTHVQKQRMAARAN